jgi:hypothetical protein
VSVPRVSVVVVGLVLALGCASPGTDRAGRGFIAIGDQVVAALEETRRSTGRYPPSLSDLPGSFDLGAPGTADDFQYAGREESFQLTLVYTPSWPNPGRVSCGYVAHAKTWKCGGYL